jgi:hypothetical protein
MGQMRMDCSGRVVCLLSTFQELLRVTLDEQLRLCDVRRLDSGRGIYFGLTRGEDEVFVVARNLDIHKRPLNPGLPTNCVLSLDPDGEGPCRDPWTVPEFADLHQVRYRDGLLWVVNGRCPELLAVDPVARRCVAGLSLADLVPAELHHEIPPQYPGDRYHFNSLHFGRRSLWVLAHNWDWGSFALELDYPSPSAFFRKPRVLRVVKELGRQAHDLLVEGDRLHALDGDGNRLVTAGPTGPLAGVVLPGPNHFPRGLGAGEHYFFVAGGANAVDRQGRETSASHLTVLDRRSREVVTTLELGPFGDTCGVLLLSERDATDSLPRLPRPGQRRLAG